MYTIQLRTVPPARARGVSAAIRLTGRSGSTCCDSAGSVGVGDGGLLVPAQPVRAVARVRFNRDEDSSMA